MKKFILVLFLTYIILPTLETFAQSGIKLVYGAGVQYNHNIFGFKYEFQKREQEIFELKDNFSPFLSFEIRDKNENFPLSFGVKISYLDFQGEVVRLPTQGYDIFGYPFYDDYTYQFHHRWINLQLPVKFNYSFKNSDLSFAYVSGIYFNSFKHYQIKENNSPPTLDFLGSSNSISHQSPDDIRLCADLLFNYTYYFSKFAKKRIGVQGFFSYPLICPIVTSIGKTYSYLSYNIENYEFTTSRRLGVKPISFGLGIVLN